MSRMSPSTADDVSSRFPKERLQKDEVHADEIIVLLEKR